MSASAIRTRTGAVKERNMNRNQVLIRKNVQNLIAARGTLNCLAQIKKK